MAPATEVDVSFSVPPAQSGVFEPSEGALGLAFTVMVTFFLAVHPVVVLLSISRYMVVPDGATFGFEELEVNPEGLLVQL